MPLILVHGDEAACKETQEQFPQAITVSVKKAESYDRCTGPDAATARKMTAEKIAEAIQKLRTAKPAPFKPKLPMRVSLRLTEESRAEAIARRPGVKRIDAFTVEAEVQRQCDVIKWINDTGVP